MPAPGTATEAPSITPSEAMPMSPTTTVVHLLDNGQPCTSNDECQSDNCQGGVCCILGMTCCDADADCPPDNRCEATRFYCVPATDESQGKEAEARIAELQAQIDKLKQGSPDVELATVETLIAQANEKLTDGELDEAYRLSVEAMSAMEGVRKAIKRSIGEACTENAECETVNCQNKLCCIAGEVCCSLEAHCRGDQRCDTERFYCVLKDDDEEAMTLQGRLAEALTDPQQLVTIVAAIVLGLGLGIYQLRGRLWEEKREKEFNTLQRQVRQMQQYPGPGGQWQQQQPQQWQPPEGGWGT